MLIFFYSLLSLLLLLSGSLALLCFRRRKRLWFVGTGRSAIEKISEQRRLSMLVLKDLDTKWQLQKIAEHDYQKERQALLEETLELTQKLDKVQSQAKQERLKIEQELLSSSSKKSA